LKITTVIIFSFITFLTFSQKKYRVILKGKAITEFNPWTYFDQKTLNRRTTNNLSLFDYYDLPVSEYYIEKRRLYESIII